MASADADPAGKGGRWPALNDAQATKDLANRSLIGSLVLKKNREYREQQELRAHAAQQIGQLSEVLHKNGGASYLPCRQQIAAISSEW